MSQSKKYFADYAKIHRSGLYAKQVARKRRNRQFAESYKISHPCIDCGETDPDCLDFDHKDPIKKAANISQMKGASLDKIQDEIDKCDVRCSNCHRKRHARQLREGKR